MELKGEKIKSRDNVLLQYIGFTGEVTKLHLCDTFHLWKIVYHINWCERPNGYVAKFGELYVIEILWCTMVLNLL